MKRYKIVIISMSLLLAILIYIAVSIYISYNWLTVHEYEYTTEKLKADQKVKMLVLSDLHDHEFGGHNQRLVEKVRGQNPDLILLVGDILNEDAVDARIPCELIEELKGIAPVCFSLGNHEEVYIENNHPELIQELEEAGAVVLDKAYVDLETDGVALRLGGMYDYAFGKNGDDSASVVPDDVKDFLLKYQDTDRVKVMMAHRPDSFIFGDAASTWNVDFVVSGHNHGGQVVLPFWGGLYGGDQGWFPKYVHGMYQKDKIQMFVTSGLGSHRQALPRFNNPPEIAVVTIAGKNSK